MIAGIGLHVIIAILFAVHVVRTHQQLYWLFILFAFPGLGSLVYFLAVFLPNSRLQHGASKAMSKASRALDPGRTVRLARDAFEQSPTAQNQMRLANALLDAGDAPAAAAEFQQCLAGPFANDPEIRFGAARALVECGRFDEALAYLQPLRSQDARFRPEAMSLLVARALGGRGDPEGARAEFEHAIASYNSFDALAEYAIWAWNTGDRATAQRLDAELEKRMKHWTGPVRELNAQTLRRIAAARR
jgi:hypothetical protein